MNNLIYLITFHFNKREKEKEMKKLKMIKFLNLIYNIKMKLISPKVMKK